MRHRQPPPLIDRILEKRDGLPPVCDAVLRRARPIALQREQPVRLAERRPIAGGGRGGDGAPGAVTGALLVTQAAVHVRQPQRVRSGDGRVIESSDARLVRLQDLHAVAKPPQKVQRMSVPQRDVQHPSIPIDDRQIRNEAPIRHAASLERDGVRELPDRARELVDESRLAHPGLADDADHLPCAGKRLLPEPIQEGAFLLAASEGHDGWSRRPNAGFRPQRTDDTERTLARRRRCHFLRGDMPVDGAPDGLADENGPGHRELMQQIRRSHRLADRRVPVSLAPATRVMTSGPT